MTAIDTGYLCSCITCSDQGIEMVVLDVDVATGLARCREAAGTGEGELVDVELVVPVAAGDLVLVHAGVALVLLARGALA